MDQKSIQIFDTFDEEKPDIKSLSSDILHRIAGDYEKTIRSLNVVFTDDESILSLNRTYLDHDWYTDVLTFPYSEDENIIDAEIYCSYDRILENANVFNVAQTYELYRIMIHGMLHLCGESDLSNKEREKMQRLEDEYIKQVNVPRGTSE